MVYTIFPYFFVCRNLSQRGNTGLLHKLCRSLVENATTKAINDVDFKIKVTSHIAEISSDLKHLVTGNDRQDRALEETKEEIKEVKQDIKKHRSFIDKAIGVILMLVFIIPVFEAYFVYQSIGTPQNQAEIRQN